MSEIENLVEALPYISKYNGKVVVVKYGGAAMLDDTLQKAVMTDLVALKQCGLKPVVVHGGGKMINKNLEQFDIKAEFVDGLRYTDKQTMEIVQMTLIGDISKYLVKLIQNIGGHAIGISGIDDSFITAEPMGKKYGLVGNVSEIDTTLMDILIENNFIPVISPVGVYNGKAFNINADMVAAAIASSLQAEKLIVLSNVDGVMNGKELISVLKLSEIPKLIDDKVITGAMIPKISACMDALRLGVRNVHIVNGTIPHSILTEIFTDQGIGTIIERW
ncbi:MAG: acetylglutamate kinase [Clostridiales bacterium]|jgi:acetylglutamate kinase|nr:acetylglutamate kinase [Clostridiales bacterium]